MSYKIIKTNKLTNKDIKLLNLFILNNFNKIQTWDQMFPDKVMVDAQTKINYFRYILEVKSDVSHPFIDNYFKEKFSNLHLSKERVLTDIMDTIQIARNSGDLKSAFTGYKLLSDLLGMNITKSQIELTSTSLVLHYHQPNEITQLEQNNQVTIGH